MSTLCYTDTSALFTDFYELTMAQGYWKNEMNYPAVFDMFCRKNPFHGGFSVFAGLETLIEYIENFTFSKEDIEYQDTLNPFTPNLPPHPPRLPNNPLGSFFIFASALFIGNTSSPNHRTKHSSLYHIFYLKIHSICDKTTTVIF